ncbi:hypothetical protein [Serratia liquefaciens]|uniref:hypothetical protein n=1 Tax=Serratia liquefaciens TaxID=614 RepID=UPI00235E7D50|nr:hypothetical protein [Serratia liquefaciens]
MAFAEKLRLEGEQRGLQKGMVLGEEKRRQKGVLEGKLPVAHTINSIYHNAHYLYFFTFSMSYKLYCWL